jgi:hypothetical protein
MRLVKIFATAAVNLAGVTGLHVMHVMHVMHGMHGMHVMHVMHVMHFGVTGLQVGLSNSTGIAEDVYVHWAVGYLLASQTNIRWAKVARAMLKFIKRSFSPT